MAQVIKPKRSYTAGDAPTTSDLAVGEIAINTADAKLYIRDNSNNIVAIAGGGGTASGATTEVTQSSHGFSVKDCIRHNGTNWVKAQANSAATLALGMVTEVADSNTFTVAQSGRFELSSHGLTVGQWYYLSADTAGGLVTSEPSFSQPLVYVESANHVFVYPYRPTNVMISGQTPLGIFVDEFTGNGSTAAYTLSGDPLDEKNTQVFVNGVYQEKATYSISGTTLTFDDNIANGSSIEVVRYAATAFVIGVPDNNSVTSAKIVDGTIVTADLADDAVTVDKMAVNSVDSDQYVDGSIDTAHIANDQITNALMADDAVGVAQLSASGTASSSTFLRGDNSWAAVGGAYNDWEVKTSGSPFTASAKDQLLINSGSAYTVNLPAGSDGNSIIICNAGAGTVTISANGSEKINSSTDDGTLPQGNSVQLVYAGSTIGWFEI
tara:strand:- start:44340 stop:45653 length:1314 start_codon:yes stop_codon:yes gene_type:complete